MLSKKRSEFFIHFEYSSCTLEYKQSNIRHPGGEAHAAPRTNESRDQVVKLLLHRDLPCIPNDS